MPCSRSYSNAEACSRWQGGSTVRVASSAETVAAIEGDDAVELAGWGFGLSDTELSHAEASKSRPANCSVHCSGAFDCFAVATVLSAFDCSNT